MNADFVISTEAIKKMPLFEGMTDQEAAFIIPHLKVENYSTGDTVFKENSDGDKFFIILEGRVRISKEVNDKPKTLAILSAGDFFGEIALIDRGPRSASAAVLEHTQLVSMTEGAFKTLVNQNGTSAAKFLQALLLVFCKRIRNTNEHLRDVLAWSISNPQ